MTDKEKIRAEVERRLWLLVPKVTFQHQRKELENTLSFIDSLPEDVSEDLEKASANWVDDNCFDCDVVGENRSQESFKAGAQWQKERLPKWKKTEDPDGLYWSIDEATIVFKGYALDLTELEDVLEKED